MTDGTDASAGLRGSDRKRSGSLRSLLWKDRLSPSTNGRRVGELVAKQRHVSIATNVTSRDHPSNTHAQCGGEEDSRRRSSSTWMISIKRYFNINLGRGDEGKEGEEKTGSGASEESNGDISERTDVLYVNGDLTNGTLHGRRDVEILGNETVL